MKKVIERGVTRKSIVEDVSFRGISKRKTKKLTREEYEKELSNELQEIWKGMTNISETTKLLYQLYDKHDLLKKDIE